VVWCGVARRGVAVRAGRQRAAGGGWVWPAEQPRSHTTRARAPASNGAAPQPLHSTPLNDPPPPHTHTPRPKARSPG
jgi:hypothetical protein